MADGEFSKALDHLVRILQKNPDDWDSKLLYGTCRMMQGDAETAKLVHQQAQDHFESGRDIPEEQKSFWDKYKKLIFYGAIGTALVLAGGAYWGKQMQDVFESLSPSPLLVSEACTKYAGPQQPPLVRVDQHKYAGPMRPEMERQDAYPKSATW